MLTEREMNMDLTLLLTDPQNKPVMCFIVVLAKVQWVLSLCHSFAPKVQPNLIFARTHILSLTSANTVATS